MTEYVAIRSLKQLQASVEAQQIFVQKNCPAKTLAKGAYIKHRGHYAKVIFRAPAGLMPRSSLMVMVIRYVATGCHSFIGPRQKIQARLVTVLFRPK